MNDTVRIKLVDGKAMAGKKEVELTDKQLSLLTGSRKGSSFFMWTKDIKYK